jgi:hypothetical protein
MRKIVIPILLLAGSICFADTLITKDGTQHNGTLQSATAHSVMFKEGTRVTRYLRSNIQAIEFDSNTTASNNNRNNNDYAPPALSPSGSRRAAGTTGTRSSVTLPAGTEINVMTNDNIDSAEANEGQTFSADVAENVTGANGQVLIPKGSEADLVLRKVSSQGTVTGNSELVLDLQSVRVNGRRYTVSTEDVSEQNKAGIGANKRTATMVGGGAVLGTLIGAIAGGGKGAAIGAATGAAAGAGAQVLTRGKAVKVPAESKLRFKLDQPLYLQQAY